MSEVEVTLVLLLDEAAGQVLLGLKKVRFGAGKYTGFGGKIEPGETAPAAAVREMQEETGVTVAEAHLSKTADILFEFPFQPEWGFMTHVFVAREWAGQPQETEEARPQWFPVDALPFDEMWADAIYWFPRVLAGERVRCRFVFGPDNETLTRAEVRGVE
jgi:8-oxo-dGTP diphosphatase